jgi:predicted nucleotide-binding protein
MAVVLLTGDDKGGLKDQPVKNQRSRARQNVILELGFFLAKLGAERVITLFHEDVEVPSDYSGILFIPLDEGGGWRLKLASELKAAGLPVDLHHATTRAT